MKKIVHNPDLIPKLIFPVWIEGERFDVYNIEGKEHEGHNDTPKTWWVYLSEKLPDGLTPPVDSDNWKAWNISILRRLWDIRISQSNGTKEKWGATQFRNTTKVEMWCNMKLVYAFSTGGSFLDFAMAKVQYLQVMLSEHAYNFFEPEEENGRKIYWYGLPARVQVNTNETWCICIIPDYTDMPKDEWWKLYKEKRILFPPLKEEDQLFTDDLEEDMAKDRINWGEALEDGNINWFRE